MLKKNSTFYLKLFINRIFRLFRIKKIKIIVFTLLFVGTVNYYNYSREDYVILKATGNKQVAQKVKDISKQYGVDPLLVSSMMVSESSAYPFAVSHKNAKGLMQLMTPTALYIARSRNKKLYQKMKANPGLIYDPEVNIELAVIHLTNVHLFIDKKWDSALHVYNVGGGAFKKGKRNYRYVNGILKRLKKWKG